MSSQNDPPPAAAPQSDQAKDLSHRTGKPITLGLFLVACVLGLGHVYFQSRLKASRPPPHPAPPLAASGLSFQKSELDNQKSLVRTANVQIVDFDRDGRNDILVCDVARNQVILYRQTANGGFEEHVLAENIKCPAHATLVDLNKNGRYDVLVAVLGSITPSDELVGKVMLLQNEGDYHFTKHILLDDVRRVADVQVGDFNGDGAMDIAVAVFGYARGEVLWLENRGKKDGEWHFRDHLLLDRPGSIHVPVADFDGDGKLDIAAVVSQDEEELWIFQNLGGGRFQPRRIYACPNYDVGSAGLVLCDLDKDGKPDLLLPQGDNLEDSYEWAEPYHGCLWFRNLGNWNFERKRIASFGTAYAAAVGDLDGDGDMDVVLVSLCNDGREAPQPSIVWLENDGKQNFTMHPLDTLPKGLITVACGDLNGDGKADIVGGSLSLRPVSQKGMDHVTVWMSNKTRP